MILDLPPNEKQKITQIPAPRLASPSMEWSPFILADKQKMHRQDRRVPSRHGCGCPDRDFHFGRGLPDRDCRRTCARSRAYQASDLFKCREPQRYGMAPERVFPGGRFPFCVEFFPELLSNVKPHASRLSQLSGSTVYLIGS